MLKGRGRDPRAGVPGSPAFRYPGSRAPLAKPEPDYEVVDFPSEQYVNAKLEPPPPPPPRPPTGHPVDAGASCGLCGGGGARVRCTECGRRALCASCDDMYHRHPKRRHHQRQALSPMQLRDERPPLPPKGTPPVPPPRRHKMSGDRSNPSPVPSTPDLRRATLTPMTGHIQKAPITNTNHFTHQRPPISQLQQNSSKMSSHLGSMPYLPGTTNQINTLTHHDQTNTRQFSTWGQQRGPMPGFNVPVNMHQPAPVEPWAAQDNSQSWGRPMRRGTSVMELSANTHNCSGCAHCMPNPWRYDSCSNLDHPWTAAPWPQTCCMPHNPRMHPHPHGLVHVPQTPQPYRRDSRAMSRAASRAGSRAASPALSVRSRASRRPKHRTPTPSLPSSDADSESEAESDPPNKIVPHTSNKQDERRVQDVQEREIEEVETKEDSLGPAPPPPPTNWQCEHCTFVNEPGIRVCVVCCRTPTVTPKVVSTNNVTNGMEKLSVSERANFSPKREYTEKLNQKHDINEVKTKSNGNKRVSKGHSETPSRIDSAPTKVVTRLVTPTRTLPTKTENEKVKQAPVRHDIAVGPSPPKELNNNQRTQIQNINNEAKTVKQKHSVSVGPSPPRDSPVHRTPSQNVTKKVSVGVSPPREIVESRPSSRASRTNVSNTGTSPPPQSISTQTYEMPNNWDKTSSSSRPRQRRRFRDETQRERSHSRLSLSSDTRESERSAQTSGSRWEWPRDSSPNGEWSESERRQTRLTRRASHLDVRRSRPNRRSSMFGSEAPSPEPLSSNRAISLEALAGNGSRREIERGLELVQLMEEAEKLGFSAAEVHAALAQNPAAPLAWLRERWPSLCAGVRAAAARLAPGANISELEARAALARHRGAMWPAVTECVERNRRKADMIGVSEEGRLRGHVWGPPIGADDDSVPPLEYSSRLRRPRAEEEDNSDEYAESTNRYEDDTWMYLPLNITSIDDFQNHQKKATTKTTVTDDKTSDIAGKLKELLIQAGISNVNEKIILENLFTVNMNEETPKNDRITHTEEKENLVDLGQHETDFLDAYNALAKLGPTKKKDDNSNDSTIETPGPTQTSKQNKTIISSTNGSNINIRSSKASKMPTNKTKVSNNKNADANILLPKEEVVDIEIPKNNIVNQELVSTNHALDGNDESFSNMISESTNILVEIANNNVQVNTQDSSSKSTTVSDTKIFDLKAEKNSNLSDIFDNTQKLIQQMKNEINTDINSISDKVESHNEEEYSSDGSLASSEQESTYSNSPHETDNVTSEEKELTSSDEEYTGHVSKSHYVPNRTSSEDNEQFEEAMDHLDTQIDDIKKSNIEILDSIARSLKEDHTISVEISESKPQKNNIPIQEDNIKIIVQNNLNFVKKSFTTVNSFDEIYEQINSENIDTKKDAPNIAEPVDLNAKNIKDININLKPINAYSKHEIYDVIYNLESPKKVFIHETKHPVLKPVLQNISNEIKNDSVEKEKTEESNNVTKVTPNIINIPDENITPKESVDAKNIIESTILITEDTKSVKANVNVINNNNSAAKENKLTIDINNPIKTNPETLSKEDTKSNKFIFNRSNIPKLVKSLQKNKQAAVQKVTKVITSKVPVRKNSIKQYAAPNPPKTHFGNINNGNVKQLQTKLFDTKTIEIVNSSPSLDVKASTSSTISKKKQAPSPPVQVRQSPGREPVLIKENKKQFFRETCRTEDEWTDSDSESGNQPTITNTTDEENTPLAPEPTQPITLRQISGQLIDLTKVRLPEGSPERQARMLLAEGATENWEQAQLAVELISRGSNTPDALLAALECTDLPAALVYLHQDCELCASKFPEHEMVSMFRCTHRCCRECARHYFTVQITERSIADCVCPYCKEPELENLPEDDWLDYFAHMDILLKTLLDVELHELFQRKLRDRTLARDPNFRWCVECSSGFFVHPKQKKLRCPECKSVSCSQCRKPWTVNHNGLTCEQYAAWLEDNDPERSIAAVQQHLRENGLECPRCHFKYSLSRGGCMHFTCTQCKYEFCYGCGKPFMMGARCGLSEYCAKLGLHAHHPRNCLFYLRDKEPHELQTLLQMNNVSYETEATDGSTTRCPIQLQRETPTGLIDAMCGSEVAPKQAGLCKMHYVEYLAGLARALDPIPIMEVSELVAELRRRALPLPERGPWDTDPIYAGMCAEIVRDKIPLD